MTEARLVRLSRETPADTGSPQLLSLSTVPACFFRLRLDVLICIPHNVISPEGVARSDWSACGGQLAIAPGTTAEIIRYHDRIVHGAARLFSGTHALDPRSISKNAFFRLRQRRSVAPQSSLSEAGETCSFFVLRKSSVILKAVALVARSQHSLQQAVASTSPMGISRGTHLHSADS